MNRVRELLQAGYAYGQGYDGNGIGVAVLDSGIDATHPDLRGRVVYSYNYLKHTERAEDDCGHGTHISGIIGGTGVASGGRYQGLAPRCHFVSLKVLDNRGNGSSASVIQALRWLMEHGREYQVRVINISVGSTAQSGGRDSPLVRAVEEAWDAGYVVCAAAGNEGPREQSITVPGTSPRIITVGCSDDDRVVKVTGVRRVNYSGRGPTCACICKPDVVAPGSYLNSCNAFWKQQNQRAYVTKSGTSMATPVVTGCVALLLSKEPGLTGREVKLRLKDSCVNLGLPRNQQGWGRVHIPGLLQ